jgi:enediyne biosynthesis protein E4
MASVQSRLSAIAALFLSAVFLAGCQDRDAVPAHAELSRPATVDPSLELDVRSSRLLDGLEAPAPLQEIEGADIHVPVFVDVHDEVNLHFVHDNGASRAKLMVESSSGGVGWLDYDADGWQDLYLPQGGNPFGEQEERRSSADQLYRNIGGVQFERVTDMAIPTDDEFGHGAAVGDFDDDGFDDVFVSNVGPDVLYRNLGDGTFEDVTLSAGIDNALWSTSAAWADLDLDGDLDLYVCDYVDYDPRDPIACLNNEGEPGICHPKVVDAVPNRCYFNLGDGTFRELADARGLNAPDGKSLGVVIADFDGDSLPDVYVANDSTANHLFQNAGGGVFHEQAIAMGCAMSGLGQYQASMGIGFGDFDENGFPDLYVTHFTADSNTLYANFGPRGFEDVTREYGLNQPTLPYLAFGTVMSDFDDNGKQDLFVANGHIDDWRDINGEAFYMRPQLFTFVNDRWRECGAEAGPYFEHEWLGRGVASADYDNDGDMDLVVIHQNDPLALLRNESATGHSLTFRFIGSGDNRRGRGVHVIVRQGARRMVQELTGGTSYCASHEPALHFGLGASAGPCDVEVRWPNGQTEVLNDVQVDQKLVVIQRHAGGP